MEWLESSSARGQVDTLLAGMFLSADPAPSIDYSVETDVTADRL